ncbi:multidrug efflux SMR transporter [Aciduricibacillus chroicocephali]|uniref:Multidrug efflux SMR transporter n=1 Tax=Aciduricibacillus chroicocephali TaxID=3054939 RepID=A0ABY9KXV5_9BACI|nr:multidrug efflux SMR transporter [Bacillaceae bacterium 44XB]
MAWLALVFAGLLEMTGVFMIGQWHRDRRWRTFAFLIASFGLSFLLLSVAMESLSMGTAYAVWTGIGASGGAVLGMIFFSESRDWRRMLFIVMILGAAIGLKLI